MWEGMDFHNDGKVNYSEFLAATLSSVVRKYLILILIIEIDLPLLCSNLLKKKNSGLLLNTLTRTALGILPRIPSLRL